MDKLRLFPAEHDLSVLLERGGYGLIQCKPDRAGLFALHHHAASEQQADERPRWARAAGWLRVSSDPG